MTSTSRGAVAPAGDRAGTGPAATAAGAASFDAGALSAIVDDVADHAVSWAKTDAAARADLLERVIADTMAVQDDWLAAACAAKGWRRVRPRLVRSCSPASGRSSAWRACCATLCATSPRTASPPSPGRYARRRTAGCGSRSSLPAHSTGSRSPRRPPRSTCSPASPGSRLVAGQAAAYADPARPRWHRAGPGRRQRGVARAARRALQALRPGQGRRDEGQSGQRLPGAVLEPCPGRVGRRRRAAHRRRWRRGRAVPDWALRASTRCTSRARTRPTTPSSSAPVPREPAARQADEPTLDKPVTAELGNVSPVIVVPGKWSTAELLYQAEHVATMLVNNAGFNCVSARLVVTHAAWPQREAFLGALTQTLVGLTTASGLLPGRRRPAGRLRGRPPRGRGVRQRPRTTHCPGRSSGASPRARLETSASTWSRSSGRWPRRP